MSEQKPVPVSKLSPAQKAKAAECLAALARAKVPVSKLEIFRDVQLDDAKK